MSDIKINTTPPDWEFEIDISKQDIYNGFPEKGLFNGVSENRKNPDPKCELCEGTGIISMDEDMDYVHFSSLECDCIKGEEK